MALSELATQALGALSRKERTVAEMVAWLRDRGSSENEVEAAVSELVDTGALDDERFARRYAEDKRELSGWGEERIAASLTERGVAEDLVEAALEADRDGELERAVAVLEERGRPAADDASRSRCFSALARRGYSAELAYEAIRRYERLG